MRVKLSIYWILIFLSAYTSYASNEQIVDSNRVYGVTIDAISGLNNTVTSLQNLAYKPTTRIVFDEWQPASGYVNAVTQIHNVSFVMGEILDSYYMNQYTTAQYAERVNEYFNTLGDRVDVWEIGNEINGEWLGPIPQVLVKLFVAYKLAVTRNKKMALTLYYNKNCWSNPQNEMFRWVTNIMPSKMRYKIDYVLVSYYEDDCNNLQPNWQQVFDSLHVLFPTSKLGIGECGTLRSSRKAEYMNRYYRMSINTPNYIGGYFWWYYKQDCVPYTQNLWSVINNAMVGGPQFAGRQKSEFALSNYPNPFNPVTKIRFNISDLLNAPE